MVTGSRWGLKGGEAVLKLPALNDNGDFNTYRAFHLARKHERLYSTPNSTTTASRPDQERPCRRAAP